MKIKVKSENIEIALRQLKRKLKEDNRLVLFKEKKEYIKPSQKRKKMQQSAKIREQRRQNG
jgi:ribosomal protein S21